MTPPGTAKAAPAAFAPVIESLLFMKPYPTLPPMYQPVQDATGAIMAGALA